MLNNQESIQDQQSPTFNEVQISNIQADTEFINTVPDDPNSQHSNYNQQDLYNIKCVSQQIQRKQSKQVMNSYEHQAALQIISKLTLRNYSRFFIRGLTFAYINALKNQKNQMEIQKRQAIYANQQIAFQNRPRIQIQSQIQDISWPFKQLYLQQYRTPEQQQLLQFVNHCATIIQSNFKKFITEKRHRIAINKTKKAYSLLSALVFGWKTYRVYNSKKCYEVRSQIKNIQNQINTQEQKIVGRDAKKLKTLYKFVDVHSKLFSETFQIYMKTGAWVLDQNMKPKVIKNYTKKRFIQSTNPQANRKHLNVKRVTPQVQQKWNSSNNQFLKQNIDNSNSSTSYNEPDAYVATNVINQAINVFEQKPICAKGAYVINQNQYEALSSKQQSKSLYSMHIEDKTSGGQTQKQKKINLQKQNNRKKMKKRQTYDPRKAIEQQKKRKLEPSKAQQIRDQPNHVNNQQQVKTINYEPLVKNLKSSESVEKNQEKQLKGKKKIKVASKQTPNIKVDNKKVKSKVDCWSNKSEIEPDWVRQYKAKLVDEQNVKQQKTSTINNYSEHNFNAQQKSNTIQHGQVAEKFSYSWQKKQIEQLKNKSDQLKQINGFIDRHQEQQQTSKNPGGNLRQQLRIIHERNVVSKKNFHRSIMQLQETYNSAYIERYQRLIPKLQLLTYARDVEKSNKIPVIDNECQVLADEFEHVHKSSGHFWSLCSNHQKVFRGFLAQPLSFT